MTKDVFVTGTDTGVGKTLLSALLVAALDRKYWKPIQTGTSEGTDRNTIMKWADVPLTRTHAEAFTFAPPVSPHLAAREAGVRIDITGIRRPADPDAIVIEGAGGVLVPINETAYMLDLMRHLQSSVLVATRSTLGTINHTLLTVSALRQAGLDIIGVVMVGEENTENRRAIERYGNAPVIGMIPWLDSIDRTALRTVFDRYFDKAALQ